MEESGPWRGVKDAILRVWTRRDCRGGGGGGGSDPRQQGSDADGGGGGGGKEYGGRGHLQKHHHPQWSSSPSSAAAAPPVTTVDLDAATGGGRALTLATVAQPSLRQIAVPGPPTLTQGCCSSSSAAAASSSSSTSRMMGVAGATSPRLSSRPKGEVTFATEDDAGGGGGGGETAADVELLSADANAAAAGDAAEGEGGGCKAQEQLDTLIRNRGYHVKDHIPRKVLEEQVMENIRRRERIARILRQEMTAVNPSLLRDAAEEEDPAVKDVPLRPEQPERSAEMMSLLTKVWSGKGVGVLGRGTGEVDWTRSQFVQDCVREHNKLRSLHNAPPLSLSDQLCTEAQTWANRLAHYSLLEYSSEYGRGENIFTSLTKNELSGSAVAKAWYETGRTFKYNVNGSADLAHAGPFSQVVWESTRAVGIGFARGTDGRTVVVARYWPPGNIGGQFRLNVKPSINEKEQPDKNRGVLMSRTRQEAHFYVSIALEPPGKVKKCDKEKLMSGLRFPRKKVSEEESLASETLLTNAATIDSLAPTTPVRNGAARTSKLFPICCVTPAKTEERWAQPSARSYRHLQQQQQASRLEPEELDVGNIMSGRGGVGGGGGIPILKEDQIETISYSPHHSEDFSPKKKSILRNSPRSSPRLAPAPRLGEFSKLSSGGPKKLTLSPRHHGASPKKPGSISPRLGATSRLKALSGSGEHGGVVIATL
ncbi:uncharacterized protein [Macrobrachium rosenbergii]|uniref:uncharacterized protein n=1 Tax=Macrobrachium rosenbergii TaxID=79674 RepID=UPI0034D4FED3